MSFPVMPGTNRLLRISVLLPVVSMIVLGMTRPWREANLTDLQVAGLAVIALFPVAVVYLPLAVRRLGPMHLPVSLGVYLVCQAILSSLLHNLGLVRFDMVQVGPFFVVEPGVLLMIPTLLVAWQFGWQGALLGAAVAGTVHLGTGLLVHWLAPDEATLTAMTPILRPDLLYFLPLLVAYLSGLQRRQQKQQLRTQTQLREYAATAEAMAVERERIRLAEQLQTTLGHSLAGLNEQLEALGTALGLLPESTAETLTKAHRQVQTDLRLTREVITDLQAAPLEEMGLVDALHARANSLAKRHGVEVDFEASPLPEELTAEQELVLYHMADQTLNHVGHHEQVQHVQMRLTCIDQYVALTVHDDGACCQCKANGKSTATLEEIESCTQLIGGHLCYDSQEQGGNTVALWLPWRRQE